MKKVFVFILALILLAVPVSANGSLIHDGESLLTASEIAELEALYASYSDFASILVTTDSFDGQSAERYAGDFYDSHGYPFDGILLLVSLSEGEWYILTNGACHTYIDDWAAEEIGEAIVDDIRNGDYYEAFASFPILAQAHMQSSVSNFGGADGPTSIYETAEKNYGKTIAICMGVGVLIGLIAVGIMASMMKSVRSQNSASDYVRHGSMQLTNQRDIFLYSHVTRTPKPKSNSSGSSGGGSRGGAGGRI